MVSSSESNGQKHLGRRPFLAAGLVGLATTLAACASEAKNTANTPAATATPSSTPTASPTPTKPPFGAKASFNVEPGAKDFRAIDEVTGEVTGGVFISATLMAEGAVEETPSVFTEDAKTWSTIGRLLPETNYELTYILKDERDETEEKVIKFTTDNTKNLVDTAVNITNGATYGVGQILQFNLSAPIEDRAAFEKAITVTGGGDHKGSFRWYKDTMVRYRPADYWVPGTTVTVKIDNQGKDLGAGSVGNTQDTLSFTVGPKRTALADNNTKTIKMYVNDELVHTAPITLGNPDWPSVVGKLVVMEQADKYYFDPKSLDLEPGDPHWYEPFYAHNVSRLTTSGVFVHQALESAYGAVGYYNASHGCIGMFPADAKFFFDTFDPGDIVETINTGYPQADPDDGYGDWNIPFENYSDTSWKGNW